MQRYQLIQQIGQGGMGTVHEAHDSVLNRRVALKLLHLHGGISDSDRQRFLRETKVLTRLSHPNVVPILDAGYLGDLPFYTMPLLEGHDLARAVQKGDPVPFREALPLIRQLVSALAYLHGEGIVHRDLKPANVLRNRHGDVHLADFGLARASDSTVITNAGQLCGTPRYIAPELILATGEIGPAQDMYALGITLLEILSGRVVYAGLGAIELVFKLAKEPPPTLDEVEGVPVWFRTLHSRLLLKDPAARPTSHDFLTALDRAVGENPGPAVARACPQNVLRKVLPVALGALMIALLALFLGRTAAPPKTRSVNIPKPAKSPDSPAGPRRFLAWKRIEHYLPAFKRGGADARQACADAKRESPIDMVVGRVWADWIRLGRLLASDHRSAPFERVSNASNRVYWNSSINTVVAPLAAPRSDRALFAAVRLVSEQPEDGRAWLLLGYVLQFDGCSNESRTCFERGLATTTPDAMSSVPNLVWHALIKALQSRGPDALRAQCERWFSQGQYRDDHWRELSIALKDDVELYKELLERCERSGLPIGLPRVYLCETYFRQHDPDRALWTLQIGLERDPLSIPVRARFMKHWLAAGQPAKARRLVTDVGAARTSASPELVELQNLASTIDEFATRSASSVPRVGPGSPPVMAALMIHHWITSNSLSYAKFDFERLLKQGDVSPEILHGVGFRLHAEIPADEKIAQVVRDWLFGTRFDPFTWDAAAGALATTSGQPLMLSYLEEGRRRWPNEGGLSIVQALWDSRSGRSEAALSAVRDTKAEPGTYASSLALQEIALRSMVRRQLAPLARDLGARPEVKSSVLFESPFSWRAERAPREAKLLELLSEWNGLEAEGTVQLSTPAELSLPFWVLARLCTDLAAHEQTPQEIFQRARCAVLFSGANYWLLEELNQLAALQSARLDGMCRGHRGFIIAGAGDHYPPQVLILEAATGATVGSFLAHPPHLGGDIRVTAGDLTGDGIADLVVVPRAGEVPLAKVFDLSDLRPGYTRVPQLVNTVPIMPVDAMSGATLAAADVNGDGRADLIAGTEHPTTPLVTVHEGNGRQIVEFVPRQDCFSTGVHVAAGDLDGDGRAEIVLAPGACAHPVVVVHDGSTGAVRHVLEPGPDLASSVIRVAVGDVDADGTPEIVLAALSGQTAHVHAYSTRSWKKLWTLPVGDGNFKSTPNLALLDIDCDGAAELIVGGGRGGPSRLLIYDARRRRCLPWAPPHLLVFPHSYEGGFSLAAVAREQKGPPSRE